MNLPELALILTSVALSSGSQILLKIGMTSDAVLSSLKTGSPVQVCQAVLTSPPVLTGLASFGVSAVFWLFVLSRVPLSLAFPFISLGIVVSVLAGFFLLGEPIPIGRIAGTGCIVLGICLVAAT
jgi:multidrug transporter EmrE-like cation transporter